MRLGTFNYYADYFITVILVTALAVTTNASSSMLEVGAWLGFALLGFALWTLLEYVVHRVLYHNVRYFAEMHHVHHSEPEGFIGAPAAIGPMLIFVLFFAPVYVFSFAAASGLTAGLLAGYFAYMLVHHAVHHWKLQKTSWLYAARRHHALHHHHSEEGNFGVTTSFWDLAFGTALRPGHRSPRHSHA